MNSIEFSNAFEIEYNNIMSNQSPGIDEYEKSVFLTKGQLELVKNYFNPKGTKYQEGYDDTAKRQYDFSTLNKVQRYTRGITYIDYSTEPPSPVTTEVLNEINFRELIQYNYADQYVGDDVYSVFPISTRDKNVHRYKYDIPDDFLFFLNEEAELERTINNIKVTKNAIVTPISYDVLTTLRGNVYKFPTQHEIWRVITNTKDDTESEAKSNVEILAPYASEIINYSMRYIKKPKPIVLINIGDMYGTTIDGESGENLPNDVSDAEVCELPEAMHPEIVQRAVELAKAAYRTGETEALINVGTRAE